MYAGVDGCAADGGAANRSVGGNEIVTVGDMNAGGVG